MCGYCREWGNPFPHPDSQHWPFIFLTEFLGDYFWEELAFILKGDYISKWIGLDSKSILKHKTNSLKA